MESVESRLDRVQALEQGHLPQPVAMMSLLRYRATAEYPGGHPDGPCTGREAYHRYAQGLVPLLERIGGRVLFMGQVAATILGPEEHWDDIILIEYKSETDFLHLIQSDGYRAVAHHRGAALADARLLAMRPRVST